MTYFVLIHNVADQFTAPYLLANMTNLDPSGRIAIIVNFVVACGMELGPALAALVLDYTMPAEGAYDYNAVIIFGILCLFISFPLLCMVMRVNSQAEK